MHYHGRDVAVMRAKLAGCPLVLGSATPSMESFVNARARTLPPARAAASASRRGRCRRCEIVDLRAQRRRAPPVR